MFCSLSALGKTRGNKSADELDSITIRDIVRITEWFLGKQINFQKTF